MRYWEKHLEKIDTEEVIKRFYKDPRSVDVSINGVSVYVLYLGGNWLKAEPHKNSVEVRKPGAQYKRVAYNAEGKSVHSNIVKNKADFIYLNGLKSFVVKKHISASFEDRYGDCFEEVICFERLPL